MTDSLTDLGSEAGKDGGTDLPSQELLLYQREASPTTSIIGIRRREANCSTCGQVGKPGGRPCHAESSVPDFADAQSGPRVQSGLWCEGRHLFLSATSLAATLLEKTRMPATSAGMTIERRCDMTGTRRLGKIKLKERALDANVWSLHCPSNTNTPPVDPHAAATMEFSRA